MSMWTSTNKTMTYDQAKDDASKAHKDIKMVMTNYRFDTPIQLRNFTDAMKQHLAKIRVKPLMESWADDFTQLASPLPFCK